MRLIVDANILLAGFIKASITRELLFDERLELFAPEHLLIETLNVLKKDKSIKRKVNLTDEQIEDRINKYLMCYNFNICGCSSNG